jgi:DNA repair protein SbcC/Rad50
LLEQQRNLASQADSIKWLVANLSEHQRLSREVQRINGELQRARAEASRLAKNVETRSAETSAIENRTGQILREIQSQEKELSSISSFSATINEWRASIKSLYDFSEAITKTTEQASHVENEIKNLSEQLQQASSLVVNAQTLLRRAQQSQSDLQTLLDSLSQYVTNEVCPLCGTPHKSKAELLREIDRQRGSHNETVNRVLLEVESTKSSALALEQRLEKLRQSQVSITTELNSLIEERDKISARIEQYADRALALGIVETDPDRCEDTANRRASVLAKSLTDKRQELSAQSEVLEQKQSALAVETQQRNREQQNVIALESGERAAADLLSQLQTKAATLNLEFESAEARLKELDRLNEELEKSKLDLDASKDGSDKARAECNRVTSAIEQIEKQIRELEAQLSATRRVLEEIEKAFARLDFSLDVTPEEVGAFRMRLEERELTLENLRSRVIDFEIALDAAQTQAALVKLQDEVGSLSKTEEVSTARIDALNSWRIYFNKIHDSLSNVQQMLLTDYVNKYGPLASKIQQRLRPVYGFGELKLRAEEGGIAVTVERNGVQLPPSDYFSESQLQIVMLSLFLSAVLTQTWSSFGLILLDDPVTHFDDLNEYALLDVIRGLVDTAGIRHQFVLSTCEERLYRLMRQRFSKIKTDVAFYEFQSIGEKGPVVVRR